MCGDSGELFNVLHLARLMLLLVLYIFSLDFLKNVIVVRGWLADNKYLMQRRMPLWAGREPVIDRLRIIFYWK